MLKNSLLKHRITFSGWQTDANQISSFVAKTPVDRRCLIQQETDQKSAYDGNVNLYTFACYINQYADIAEDDKAVDQDGKEYQVVGIQPKNYKRQPNYAKVILSG